MSMISIAINILVAVLWLLSAVADYCNYIHIWQLKEYRWDRFRDFLTTEKGRQFWIRYPLLWRSILGLIILFFLIDIFEVKLLLLVLFTIDLVYNFTKYKKRRLYRPIFTNKSALIFLMVIGLESLVLLIGKDWSWALVVMIIRFLIVTVVIFLLYFPTKFVKMILIKKAASKIKENPQLKVIGITGSYGKSSVKSFLFHILSGEFKVIKTPFNINTEIGIAKFILSHNFHNQDIFIVEMGAYKIGEIKKICDMVHPRIGILTAINEQHLSLFGCITNTQQAKYELLRSLPKDGLAVVNSDNSYCREFLVELRCQVKTFGVDDDFNPSLLIKDITSTKNNLKFIATMDNLENEVEMSIWGEHNAMNVAPCFLAASFLGMKTEAVRQKCQSLKMPEGKLELLNYGKAIIIDDSYNSNPDGFKAALALLNTFSSGKRRIVITRGMLELGEKSEQLHHAVGEEIALVADELIITSQDSIIPFKKGIGNKYRTEIKLILNADDLLEYVKSLKEQEVVILIENRIFSIVAQELNI